MPVDPTGELAGPPTPAAGVPRVNTTAPQPRQATPPAQPTSSGGSAGARVVPPKIMAAFRRYRIAAFVVGWGLLVLCAAMVLKYAFGIGAAVAIWGPIHGALFVVYVIIAFDLAYKDRWSPLGTLWVLVAGTIPFVSFIAERQVQRKVLSREKM